MNKRDYIQEYGEWLDNKYGTTLATVIFSISVLSILAAIALSVAITNGKILYLPLVLTGYFLFKFFKSTNNE